VLVGESGESAENDDMTYMCEMMWIRRKVTGMSLTKWICIGYVFLL